MNITAELIKWAFAHPFLASLLGITVIGGGAAVSVAVVNNVGMVAGKAIEKGAGFAVNNGKVAFSVNHEPIPFEEHQAIPEQTEVQPA